MKMKKEFPEAYSFFPKTWDLPADLKPFKSYWRVSIFINW